MLRASTTEPTWVVRAVTCPIKKQGDLFPQILRDEAVGRLYQLGKVSDGNGYLERTFLSPASMRAINVIREWMEDAGLRTWVDQMGNVHGRVEGVNPNAEALLIGSHMDTVVDAGMFDGSLGIVSAISALKALKVNGKLEKLKRPVEGCYDKRCSQGEFYRNYRGKLLQLKYDPKSVWGYVEIHIEQGPVLEQKGFPLGVVKGIAGQTRLKVTVRGSQGHAGTVPMSMRQDPMAAAAELIVVMENLCKNPEEFLSYDGHCSDSTVKSLSSSLVCTVGEISTWPSASNVIPGQVTYTVDIRAIDDLGREAVIYDLSKECIKYAISAPFPAILNIRFSEHDAGAVICDSELSSQLKSAAYSALKRMEGDIQDEVPTLMSGAGHDAMAMSHLTKVGMLFVRCRGGISHSPQEHVLDNDVWAAGLATLSFLENL
ncbi:Allantoate amidohydrolase [Arachis hypogaea]|nr:Allantoate amidohydrolase [Arachis hypogaea]